MHESTKQELQSSLKRDRLWKDILGQPAHRGILEILVLISAAATIFLLADASPHGLAIMTLALGFSLSCYADAMVVGFKRNGLLSPFTLALVMPFGPIFFYPVYLMLRVKTGNSKGNACLHALVIVSGTLYLLLCGYQMIKRISS